MYLQSYTLNFEKNKQFLIINKIKNVLKEAYTTSSSIQVFKNRILREYKGLYGKFKNTFFMTFEYLKGNLNEQKK